MMFNKDMLKGKVAVITGGGTGIGKIVSIQFAKLGAKIAIIHRKQENIDSGVKEIGKYGDCIGFVADLRNYDEVNEAFKKIADKYKKIDILINNAGGQFIAPFEKISPNGFDAVVKTNLYNIFNCCKVSGEYMKKKKYGRIVNMVHVYAVKSAAGMIHSGAARAGVINLTKSLALEWAKYNITVNGIAPGFVLTEGMQEEMFKDKKKLEKLKKEIPLQRFAKLEEISDTIVFMVSEGNDYMTGQTIVLDGGISEINWPNII